MTVKVGLKKLFPNLPSIKLPKIKGVFQIGFGQQPAIRWFKS
jgi:hypothetical protein